MVFPLLSKWYGKFMGEATRNQAVRKINDLIIPRPAALSPIAQCVDLQVSMSWFWWCKSLITLPSFINFEVISGLMIGRFGLPIRTILNLHSPSTMAHLDTADQQKHSKKVTCKPYKQKVTMPTHECKLYILAMPLALWNLKTA